MPRRLFITALAAAVAAGIVAPALATGATSSSNAYVLSEQYVPSSDGTLLHAYIFRPAADGPASAPSRRTPVILSFTPYDNTGGSISGVNGEEPAPTNASPPRPEGPKDEFADGYTYVQVADRGTGGSGGCFDIWGPESAHDGAAMVEWAAAQPWSNSQVVIYGGSAGGFSALITLALHPAHVVAAVLGYASIGSSEAWDNGVQTSVGAIWGPAWELNRLYPPSVYSPSEYITNALGRNVRDPACGGVQTSGSEESASSPYWRTRDAPIGPAEASRTPILWVGSFQDFNARENVTLSMFNKLSGPHWGFFGQWAHFTGWGKTFGGPLALNFIDHWVRHTDFSVPQGAYVQDARGSWEREAAWPPPNEVAESTAIRPGSYTDDANNQSQTQPPLGPAAPVSTGEGTWTVTSPLAKAMHIAGVVQVSTGVQVTLPVSLVAVVYDITPDGKALFVARGADRVLASGVTRFGLYPQDWTFPVGDRVGLLLAPADLYWFVPSDTGTVVSVTGGSWALPVQCAGGAPYSNSDLAGMTPLTQAPPFTVSSMVTTTAVGSFRPGC